MTKLSTSPSPQDGSPRSPARSAQMASAIAHARPSGLPNRAAALAGVSALAGLFLAACGGDGSPAAPPVPPPVSTGQVPTSAAQSPASLEAFAIAQAPSESAEPLMLDNVPTFPTSDVQEPIALP
jgi:hypothetical protein